jgi:hypothetical protein
MVLEGTSLHLCSQTARVGKVLKKGQLAYGSCFGEVGPPMYFLPDRVRMTAKAKKRDPAPKPVREEKASLPGRVAQKKAPAWGAKLPWFSRVARA